MQSIKKTIITLITSIAMIATVVIFPLNVFAYDYTGVGTVTGSVVNIREQSNTSSGILAQFRKGNKLKVISNENGWAKVEFENNRYGFMSSEYISVEAATPENCKGIVTGSAVNLRNGAGTQYGVISVVAGGTAVGVKAKDNNWVKVDYNGQIGWMCGDYVDITVDEAPAQPAETKSQQIAEEAEKYIGRPYAYGAAGPNAFDCSGFTSYIYRQFGYSISRTAAGQTGNGVAVSKANLQPGDLVMFSDRSFSGVGHVGIYVGNGNMVHAGNTSTGVCVTSINSSYYGPRFVCARRIA